MTTIAEFYEMLRHADWYYQMSDDPSVYRRGCRDMSILEGRAQASLIHKKMFEDYRRWVWMNPQDREGRMPRLEDYE